MMYARCRCGYTEVYTSMAVPACERCEQCGSDLARSPAEHKDRPAPHDFKTQYGVNRDTGLVTKYRECQSCGHLEPVPPPALDQ